MTSALHAQKIETKANDSLPRIIGIGGIFFSGKNASSLSEWYAENLGMTMDPYGAVFEVKNAVTDEINYIRWSIINESSDYFSPSEQRFMINYRVNNLAVLLDKLVKNGVTIIGEMQTYDYGKFAHIIDLEGNKVELWEPNDTYLSTLGGQTNK